ncbi:hypothetical protein B0A49_11428 [Cryomyces minteri]|uniref:Calpain catalytic domain-containing protein n=1 Tax=Cryomyces minteri TaxID=331657 RepID=A0A4U0WR22_9PEZI|nr:hypothetical protein B0A49_11428 [Cryomyces minteri]
MAAQRSDPDFVGDFVRTTDFVGRLVRITRPPNHLGSEGSAEPCPKPRMKKQPPQKSIDQFWEKFTTKTPGKAFTILPTTLAMCKSKVAKIVKECRRVNQKYRDPHFDIERDFTLSLKGRPPDCLMGLDDDVCRLRPLSVKRVEDIFDDPHFFIEGATASDVRQGKDGDCWFMSALCTLSNMKELIERVCVQWDEQVGVYGFVFHRDGDFESVVIDDKLYLIKEDFNDATLNREQWLELKNRKNEEEEYRAVMQTGSRALYFAQCSDQNETWLPLLEKAYAKAHGDYQAIDGGFVGEGIEDLTGGVTTEVFATDILDKDAFWKNELQNVNKHFLFGCGQLGGIYGERKGIMERHAYSIMEAVEMEGERLVKLRNPWGNTEWRGAWSDGSEEWNGFWMEKLNHRFGDDGVFWMSYKDLLKTYQHFDRTRLFGDEWQICQHWTSLSIPWKMDYLNTKFQITLAKPGPVVIVLSQLDDRYFRGLEGEYEFKLQFRLHVKDEKDYIVRSQGTYYMKRSVSTEVELEAGVYSVVLKITAHRCSDRRKPEQVVRERCVARREKLLAIGLSYDLAHAKGHFKESESEKRERDKKELKEKRKAQAKKMHEARRRDAKKRRLREKRRHLKLASKAECGQGTGVSTPGSVQFEQSDDNEAEAGTEDDTSKSGTSGENAGSGDGAIEHKERPTTSEPLTQIATETEHHSTKSSGAAKNSRGARPATLPLRPKGALSNSLRTPTLRINDSSAFPSRQLSLADISDDDLSWDSEIDIPSSDSRSDFGDASGYRNNDCDRYGEESEDDFERDPWNAVCVVGLRVYSTAKGEGDVKIEVCRPEEKEAKASLERKLDVDDSAADATRNRGAATGKENVDVEVVGGSPAKVARPLRWR